MIPELEYYEFNEIKFNRRQMLWLIKMLPTLKEGRWPPNPLGSSGYTKLPLGRKSLKHQAGFEKPEVIIGEVEARLGSCGRDGLVLKALELWEEEPAYLAKCFGVPVWSILRSRSSALDYISGWRRKQATYREYKLHTKSQAKLRSKVE